MHLRVVSPTVDYFAPVVGLYGKCNTVQEVRAPSAPLVLRPKVDGGEVSHNNLCQRVKARIFRRQLGAGAA